MKELARNPYITNIKLSPYGNATDLLALPVGTKFHVSNGLWDGEIIETNNSKMVYIEKTPTGPSIFKITDKHRYSLVLDKIKLPSGDYYGI